MDSFSLLQGIFLTQVTALQADSLPAEPQGKSKNTAVGSLSLFQGVFLTQESDGGLLHCRWVLYQFIFQGSPRTSQGKPKNPFNPPHYIDTVMLDCVPKISGIFQFSLFLFFCSLTYIISLSTMYATTAIAKSLRSYPTL